MLLRNISIEFYSILSKFLRKGFSEKKKMNVEGLMNVAEAVKNLFSVSTFRSNVFYPMSLNTSHNVAVPLQ